MYLGHPVEQGPRDAIFANPQHPYTQALLSATPKADPTQRRQRIRLSGELPSPLDPPSGCTFNPRCPYANERCRIGPPLLLPSQGSRVRSEEHTSELQSLMRISYAVFCLKHKKIKPQNKK